MRIMLAIMTTAEMRSGNADPSSARRHAYRSAGGSATGFKPIRHIKLRHYQNTALCVTVAKCFEGKAPSSRMVLGVVACRLASSRPAQRAEADGPLRPCIDPRHQGRSPPAAAGAGSQIKGGQLCRRLPVLLPTRAWVEGA